MTKEQKEKLAKYRRTKEYMVSDNAYLEYSYLLYLEEIEKEKRKNFTSEDWT
ncbi:hypothetical protein [Stenotrophomonas phage StenR_269]|nr:hypothetical protein [Stenotrophomonas phage StenR_269]